MLSKLGSDAAAAAMGWQGISSLQTDWLRAVSGVVVDRVTIEYGKIDDMQSAIKCAICCLESALVENHPLPIGKPISGAAEDGLWGGVKGGAEAVTEGAIGWGLRWVSETAEAIWNWGQTEGDIAENTSCYEECLAGRGDCAEKVKVPPKPPSPIDKPKLTTPYEF